MSVRRRVAVGAAVAVAAGLVFTGTAAAGSTDCRDWWTIADTTKTVFTDATQTVKFWGHRSCGGTTTPSWWEAPYRPDEPGDHGWDSVKKLHGNDPGAVAYGFELHRASKGWIATGFAAAHG
jgi:hypothetical protein